MVIQTFFFKRKIRYDLNIGKPDQIAIPSLVYT